MYNRFYGIIYGEIRYGNVAQMSKGLLIKYAENIETILTIKGQNV